jgi:hypothetical protein
MLKIASASLVVKETLLTKLLSSSSDKEPSDTVGKSQYGVV